MSINYVMRSTLLVEKEEEEAVYGVSISVRQRPPSMSRVTAGGGRLRNRWNNGLIKA